MVSSPLSAACILLANLSGSSAFVAGRANRVVSSLSLQSNDNSEVTRRGFMANVATASAVVAGASKPLSSPAFAASTDPPTAAEIERIKVGYKNIQYLLDNWEKETTVCRENGGECKRDADAARRYLGLRSTTDPLFQIEKVFLKVKYMDDIDVDKLETFFEATEDWNTAMNMSNSMAFISQFAEYNPGGGKDEVLKYLNEAEIQVKLAEKALKVILDCVTSSPQ